MRQLGRRSVGKRTRVPVQEGLAAEHEREGIVCALEELQAGRVVSVLSRVRCTASRLTSWIDLCREQTSHQQRTRGGQDGRTHVVLPMKVADMRRPGGATSQRDVDTH
jgi:hypothetical protein